MPSSALFRNHTPGPLLCMLTREFLNYRASSARNGSGVYMPKRKQSQSQLDNLIQYQEGYSSEIARKNGAKGGKAKGENAKIYRPVKEIFKEGLDEETVRKIFAALMQKAMDGDVRAWESLRDSSGQKPKDEVQMDNTVRFFFDDPDAEDYSG